MERESVDREIDAVIAARGAAAAFVSAAEPPWLAPFEQSLPFRLPPSYRAYSGPTWAPIPEGPGH
jgi:hypothetical protein